MLRHHAKQPAAQCFAGMVRPLDGAMAPAPSTLCGRRLPQCMACGIVHRSGFWAEFCAAGHLLRAARGLFRWAAGAWPGAGVGPLGCTAERQSSSCFAAAMLSWVAVVARQGLPTSRPPVQLAGACRRVAGANRKHGSCCIYRDLGCPAAVGPVSGCGAGAAAAAAWRAAGVSTHQCGPVAQADC